MIGDRDYRKLRSWYMVHNYVLLFVYVQDESDNSSVQNRNPEKQLPFLIPPKIRM